MNAILSFLFPRNASPGHVNVALALFRVAFGLLLAQHGLDKLSNFDTLSTQFPDPLGLGSSLSLTLAIFGELICSLAFVIGFLHRLVLIPMIFTMGVALFSVHGGNISEGELACAYLAVFVIMYIAGPGTISVDQLIAKKIRH